MRAAKALWRNRAVVGHSPAWVALYSYSHVLIDEHPELLRERAARAGVLRASRKAGELSTSEPRIDIGEPLEPRERSLVCDLLCGLQEPSPCGSRERTPDADPAHS